MTRLFFEWTCAKTRLSSRAERGIFVFAGGSEGADENQDPPLSLGMTVGPLDD